MPESKHTPGPWVPYFWSSLTAFHGLPSSIGADTDEGEFDILRFDDEHRDIPAEEQHANARLIAAAPDLLAALEEVFETYAEDFDAGRPVMEAVRAAIAKARGET